MNDDPVSVAEEAVSTAREEASRGRFGMLLFLASLSMLFAASLVGFLVVRSRADSWLPTDAPGLPPGLYVATALLIMSSLTMHFGIRAQRKGDTGLVGPAMAVTLALGLGFLALQVMNWAQLYGTELAADSSMYAFTFFMLTGLHGLHVIGGIIPLTLVTSRAFRGYYTPEHHNGLTLTGMYWHFLDGVWVILFVVLLIFS